MSAEAPVVTAEQYIMHQERNNRWRAVMYFLMSAAGVCAVLFPSDLVKDQVGSIVVASWSLGLVLSAVTCCYGALTDKWIGEYSGLPLLAAVLFLYGCSAMLGAGFNPSPLFAYGLIIIGVSSGLVARWLDVRAEKKRAEEGCSDNGNQE